MNYALRDTDEWTGSLKWSPTWIGLHPEALPTPVTLSDLSLAGPTPLTSQWSSPIDPSYVIAKPTLSTSRNFVGLLEPLSHELALLDLQSKWVSNSFDLSFERILPDYIQSLDYFEHPFKLEIETSSGWEEISEVFNYTSLFLGGYSNWIYDNGQIIIAGLGLKQVATETHSGRSYIRDLTRDPNKPVYVVMGNNRLAALHPSEVRSDGLLPINTGNVIIHSAINPSQVNVRINDTVTSTANIISVIDHSYYSQLFWNTSVNSLEASATLSLLKSYVKDTSNLSVKIGIGASLGLATESQIEDGQSFPVGAKLLESRFRSIYQKVYDYNYLIEDPLSYYSEDNYLLPLSGGGVESLRTLIIMQDKIRESVYTGRDTSYAESEVDVLTRTTTNWKFKWQRPTNNLLGGDFE